MIIDTLASALDNCLYPPVLRNVLQAIQTQHPSSLAPGKYEIQGEDIYFSVVEGETKPLHEQQPEYHRKYIDIHWVLSGKEIIGAGPCNLSLVEENTTFKQEHDIGFYHTIYGETLIQLHPGELAIIFPQELHRPMCTLTTPNALRKIIVKVNSALLSV